MPDDGSASSTAAWPTPRFYFEVTWGDDTVMHFQEVSGLDAESQVIEYRSGNSPQFSAIKMPGLKKFSDVTLKKGTFRHGPQLLAWINEIKMNTAQRKSVTIRLLDEAGAPTMVWTLSNAWPTKVSGTDLKATGDAGAVETMVVAHEGITLANA